MGPPIQRLYPQCRDCSDLQSVAVRTGRLQLITHYPSLRLYHATGVAENRCSLHFPCAVVDAVDGAILKPLPLHATISHCHFIRTANYKQRTIFSHFSELWDNSFQTF